MRYISILIIVLIPITIILINVSILAKNYNFYLKIYKTQNIYNNFPNDFTLISETKNLLGYFNGKNILDQNFYSEQANTHLKDVKDLLNLLSISSFIACLVVISISIFFVYKRQLKKLMGDLATGAIITIILTIVVSVLTVVNFQSFFLDFHQIFFRNNYWLFDQSDNLVKMFPEKFFIAFANILVANIIVTSLVLFLLAKVIRKINDQPSA